MFTPIAIVGQACLLPGAHSPDELWTLVQDKRVALSAAVDSRWRADRRRMLANGICASDSGGFVTGFKLDREPWPYAVDPELARKLDPLVQWLLHVGQAALADAGISHETPITRMGAIIGNLMYPTESLVDIAEEAYLPGDSKKTTAPLNRFSAGLPVHILCKALRLGAGGYAIDAACASSLYAIKLACDWLHSGRADAMLAGAINRVEGLQIHAGFTALRALSPTGQSRPFHREADGLVPAEGAALLVLKRLSDAEQAGDRILGIIRGVGLSNDGRGTGMLTPSVEGQIRAMNAAYAESGLRPRDISLIECHATGTSVGDAIELQSMSAVFKDVDGLPIGSLKSNLGHLITASGAAGVIKILAALRHGIRPATLNASPVSQALAQTPFRILEDHEAWKSNAEPRRAGINSFGFGGNNAHLLLEEYRPGTLPQMAPVPRSRRAAVVYIAARMGDGAHTNAFLSDFFTARTRSRAENVRLPVTGLVFPPVDLDRTLAQQNVLLELACEASAMQSLPPARTSVFVGMNCDAEITRTILQTRLEIAELFGDQMLDAGFDAARVVGCMPNILANRLNRQFGWEGPSFSVAGEELSGVRALDIAADLLSAGLIDTAVVGAVDLCVEPTYKIGATALTKDQQTPGDGACLLVLKRPEDAERDRDPIHAILEMDVVGAGLQPAGPDDRPSQGACDLAVAAPAKGRRLQQSLDSSAIQRRVRDCFGHVHAASGLLNVVAAAVALSGSAAPEASHKEIVPILPAAEPHKIQLTLDAMYGQSAHVTVTEAQHLLDAPIRLGGAIPQIVTFAANDLDQLIEAVERGEGPQQGLYRLAIVAAPDELSSRMLQAQSYLRGVVDHAPVGARDRLKPAPTVRPEGVFFRVKPVTGDLAFVYTGAMGAYRGMGRDLLLAFPQLSHQVSDRCRDINRYAGWIYRGDPADVPTDFERLSGSSFLCQVHHEWTTTILGLQPQAAIGLSSGETNSMYAFGAWRNMHELLDALQDCGLYTEVLGGRASAVHEAWRGRGITGKSWTGYWISAPVTEVAEAVRAEPAVAITIINSPEDVVIGGDHEACERVAAFIGPHRCVRLNTDFAAHCAEVKPAAELWRQLHSRPTVQPANVRFYSNALGHHYDLTQESVADALTAQAVDAIDFPRTIRRAWDDGVRIFVEHGPRSQCTQSIRTILGDREFLAVALDTPQRSSLYQGLYAAAELWTAGVDVDFSAVRRCLGHNSTAEVKQEKVRLLPAHPPFPTRIQKSSGFKMTPAPELAAVLQPVKIRIKTAAAVPVTVHTTGAGQGARNAIHEQITKAHQEHLNQVALLDQAYQQMQSRLMKALIGGAPVPATLIETARPPQRTFSRHDLETHASGRISDVFGASFKEQDRHLRQVRMPEPPLLLADRVTSLTGEPGSMKLGSIQTETDIVPNAWYLHHGRMPAGILIESGQADLMLISWLGIDRLNQGRRVYRLLGCDLKYFGNLPSTGQTLRYDIHVDSHTNHGDVRIFFFHYDCYVGDQLQLSVRNAHAGFFTDDELKTSEGVLWTPEANPPESEFAPPPITRTSSRRSFSAEEVSAFAAGNVVDCFGPELDLSYTHTRTPRIANGRMQLLQTISIFDPQGGPWKRGYLRAEWAVDSEDWFFKGHFKNDPCMPGTLMFEGCLQAMAFYMTALGVTLERDGWRFEPVPEQVYELRCRGQVLPSSTMLVYEVFVDQIVLDSVPVLYADVLCTVDGLKAFHCPRLGLRLVPDWPMRESMVAGNYTTFNFESLMACALGRPSDAFGTDFSRFDSPIKTPRLPGPPYHFLSRVTRAEKTPAMAGSFAELEYDVPSDAWYFSENGCAVMPFSVLVEVLLQPCGWLASYAGTWKNVQHDVYFRNLDGNGVVHAEVTPQSGTLRVHTTLTSVSPLGSTSITAYKITCHAGDQLIFDGEAVFGHFPAASLRNQIGLTPTAEEQHLLSAPAPAAIDLENLPDAALLGREKLRLIHRITGFWPDGGATGKGCVRAEIDVHPRQWFFKAHFFGDPVQPGSLGLEAVVQTLQIYMLETKRHVAFKSPRFEAIAVGQQVTWTYRGQVVPQNKRCVILLDILEADTGFVRATASFWVDGKKIYSVSNLSMRVVEGSDVLDPAVDQWLCDHCPTYTVPVLPMMSVIDRLAGAAITKSPSKKLIELQDVTLNGWIAFGSGPRRLLTDATAIDSSRTNVSLSVWRDAPHASLSRFDVMASAKAILADGYPAAPARWDALDGAMPVPGDPYESGELFHGPRFHFAHSFVRSAKGASFIIDTSAESVPRGFLNQGLFDGLTHGIPNDNLRLWSERIGLDKAGYPSRIPRLSLFADTPADGITECELRFAGFHDNDERHPAFRCQLIKGGLVWAEMDLVYVLFPKGPIGMAPPSKRRDFLQHRVHVPGVGLGRFTNGETRVAAADVYNSDWLPGTLDTAYALTSNNRLSELAVKEHVARIAEAHPSTVRVAEDLRSARCSRYPLTDFAVQITANADECRVKDDGEPRLNCDPVRRFWKGISGKGEWPVADLHMGLCERFIRRVEVLDPAGFETIRSKPAIYLANHQVAVESILFNVIVSALSNLPLKVIAKKEHRQSWIGQLIALTNEYPGVRQTEPILFFDRSDPQSIFKMLTSFRNSLDAEPAGLMLHVDGTRARSCRTPVSQVSSVFVELALSLRCPLVPVRFVGGLPPEPVEERLEFPYKSGRQDIVIGRAIAPEELQEMSIIERSKRIVNAINALAPAEETNSGTGADCQLVGMQLIESLRNVSHRCRETNMLLSGNHGENATWLTAFSSWLASLNK